MFTHLLTLLYLQLPLSLLSLFLFCSLLSLLQLQSISFIQVFFPSFVSSLHLFSPPLYSVFLLTYTSLHPRPLPLSLLSPLFSYSLVMSFLLSLSPYLASSLLSHICCVPSFLLIPLTSAPSLFHLLFLFSPLLPSPHSPLSYLLSFRLFSILSLTVFRVSPHSHLSTPASSLSPPTPPLLVSSPLPSQRLS